jgi:hypothetical protein
VTPVGLWDALRGRRQAAPPDLDSLFLVPSAAITLQTAIGLAPTGSGSVCFRAAAGAAFRQTQDDLVALIEADPETPDVTVTVDSYGFTWLTVERDLDDPDGLAGLCTDLHAVNTALEAQGFGEGLLCTLVPFSAPGGPRVGLVYLYKRGTFYPFVPAAGRQRDNLTELQVRDALAGELPVEQDLQRWLAVWDAPGL